MRRIVAVSVVTLAFVAALPALEVNAVCEPPPAASSVEGLRVMRQTQFIILGTIDQKVPEDAHGQHSFFLNVRGYFKGIGGQRIEVSDLGDGDLPTEALRPGASIAASQEFLDRFGGQDALIFARKDGEPYEGQYVTGICTYTAYGDAAVSDILPLVRRTFGAPHPPLLSATGPASAVSLAAVAGVLLLAGIGLRVGARRGGSPGKTVA